jgi:mono/diheme cytochrome c family protein
MQIVCCLLKLVVLLAAWVLFGLAAGPAHANPPVAPFERKVAEWPLKLMDLAGNVHSLGQSAGCKAVAVVFLGTECPISNGALPALNRMHEAYAEKGVEFYGVAAEPGVTRERALAHQEEFQIGFPVLFDGSGMLRRALAATRVPQAFVLSAEGRVLYSGKIDDRHAAPGRKRPAARNAWLGLALQAAVAGRAVAMPLTEPVGCLLEEAPAESPAASTSFARDVAPIMVAHCADCHHERGAAPFPLVRYEEVVRHGRQIVELTGSLAMPPWKPVAGFGSFRNERRLSSAEIQTLRRWVEEGMPEGDARDLPPPPEFGEGWQLGQPDLVLRMPQEFEVPADGPDLYQYFVIPTEAAVHRLVSAVEFRPGNPRVIHHATMFFDTTGTARRLDQEDPGPGYARFGGPGFPGSGGLGGWGPGATSHRLPRGMGRLMRAGADLVMQVHYHPIGKPQRDRSEVGVYFAPPSAGQLVGEIVVANMKLAIPAGKARFRHVARYELPCDVTLIDVTPHMHLLGREISATALLPGGAVEKLVRIDDWDFNWHDHYVFREPLRLAHGTIIEVECVYDNSAANPRNPHSPPRKVHWGEQSTEEMGVCFFEFTTDRFEDYVRVIEENDAYLARQRPSQVPSAAREQGASSR